MRFAHFFVDRPRFAIVVSLVITIFGLVAYTSLPVTEYPEIAPPTIVVTANYPGADAVTVAETVATPLEQEMNGVEDMLYMSSYSTADGTMQLTITFKTGTDLNVAQVLVQNRVSIAEPRLPEEVRRLGITTAKSSPDLMMVVHLISPDERYDQLYISNYAQLRVRDRLLRLEGVGNLFVFGGSEYALRVWLDPDRLSSYGLSGSDVVNALRAQNVQVSGGALGSQPAPAGTAFQLNVTTQGRFDDPREFRQVIVRSTADGRLVRLGDVARIEIAAKDYVTRSYLNGKPAIAFGIFQRPGSNALETSAAVLDTMKELSKDFPPGLEYRAVYNPTEFIAQSIDEVYKTLIEAIILVALVVLVFLQSWRAALIPILAIPVSLIGTMVFLLAFGFSLNVLTLFGFVLAIGIVVDDAIVVVENVERNIRLGLSPRDAAHTTMDEVGGAVIAIAVVLVAVFAPTAFIPGISGQFYKQFAVTVAIATVISCFNSLTLSPALAAILLKPHDHHAVPSRNPLARGARWFADRFNNGFDRMANGYGGAAGWVSRRRVLMLAIYVALGALTVHVGMTLPRGFIPNLDRGFSIVVLQLPEGASLNRTDAATVKASQILSQVPGVENAIAFAGFNGATFTNASNAAVIFVGFEPFEKRLKDKRTSDAIVAEMTQRLFAVDEAFVIAIPPPAVPGVGAGGGFKMQLQNRNSTELAPILGAAYQIMGRAQQTPGLVGVFTTFSAATPQIYLEIDRVKAQMLNVPVSAIFETLQVNLGSAYVNDFNLFGRIYQVRAQSDQRFRMERKDVSRLKVRSSTGDLVPLGTLVEIRDVAGPDLVQRYNGAVSVPLQGNTAPGFSTGQALDAMENLARQVLPPGTSFEWTELALQERSTGNTAIYIFMLAVLFVFFALTAQYESWSLPLAIMLIVPMSILSALAGVMLVGGDNNILVQVGLVVLIGLAAKNAILIVEFARQLESEGKGVVEATVEACRLRLRPILMTAFAFILGVVPLVIAEGAGAEMRRAIGTAVFFGMLGVTVLGLFLTPVFYVVLRQLTGAGKTPAGRPGPAATAAHPGGAAE